MTQFKKDYTWGKESEIISLPDLRNIFTSDLNYDPYEFAHFDYYSDTHMIELKTRDRVKVVDGVFNYTTRTGYEMILDSLYFDSPKQHYMFKQKKKGCTKDYWIVWKCNNDYYGWLMTDDNNQFYIEHQNRDCGHGFKQPRHVFNIKTKYIKKLS
tara:strand:- start:440 stop:904 length:465 start_codon:yes stop_codon:yes gene_type:complete